MATSNQSQNGHAKFERELQQVREQRAREGGALYKVNNAFRRVANGCSRAIGSPWAFIIASVAVIAWAACGHLFHYSDTWQLVINTSTTIVTFLMVFLVQNTQNRDARAIHLKLDELLRGVKGARTGMVDLEDATDEELDQLQKQFEELRRMKGATSRSHHQTAQGTSPSSDPD